jgi:hypothetical protein
MRNIHELRVTLNAEALNKHLAFHSPTLPEEVASWANAQWKTAGAGGDAPGIVESRMSEAALYNILSQMRIGNPNWYMDVAKETPAGLMRELVLLTALQLELTRKNNEWLDRIAVLTALQSAAQLESANQQMLEAAYARAIGAQQ